MHAAGEYQLPLAGFVVESRTDPAVIAAAQHATCPALQTVQGARVTLSPAYYDYVLCTCDDSFFGRNGNCRSCTSDCTSCYGEVVVGCFPTPTRFIPCALTSSGTTVCNPLRPPKLWHWWNNSTVQLPDNTSGWCLQGYEGRLCSKCSSGFYRVGKECYKCASLAAQWGIGAAYATAALLVVAVVFAQADQTRISAAEPVTAALPILLFHGQCLGLLLNTEGAFSEGLTVLLSTVSASTSPSVQTVFAVECLDESFDLSKSVALTLIGLVAVVVLLLHWPSSVT